MQNDNDLNYLINEQILLSNQLNAKPKKKAFTNSYLLKNDDNIDGSSRFKLYYIHNPLFIDLKKATYNNKPNIESLKNNVQSENNNLKSVPFDKLLESSEANLQNAKPKKIINFPTIKKLLSDGIDANIYDLKKKAKFTKSKEELDSNENINKNYNNDENRKLMQLALNGEKLVTTTKKQIKKKLHFSNDEKFNALNALRECAFLRSGCIMSPKKIDHEKTNAYMNEIRAVKQTFDPPLLNFINQSNLK